MVYQCVCKNASATHIPKAIIGATIVSLATTVPEVSVSAIAAVQGHTDMSIGNAIGSCICNIALIFATCTLARPGIVDSRLLLQQGGFMLGAGIVVTLLTFNGVLNRWNGILLLVGMTSYMYYSGHTAKKRRNIAISEMLANNNSDILPNKISIGKEVLWFLIGSACVIAGSRLLVYTGVKLAKLLGVPEMVISLTIVAIGTSLPEYVTALGSAIKGHQELSAGNVIGANIINLLMVLGISSIIKPLPLNPEPSFLGHPQTHSLDIPVMFIVMIIMIMLGYFSKGRLKRWHGAILFAIYIVYLYILFGVIGS